MKRFWLTAFLMLVTAAFAEDAKPLTEAQQLDLAKKHDALVTLQNEQQALELRARQMQTDFANLQKQFDALAPQVTAAQKAVDDAVVTVLTVQKLDKEKFQIDFKTLTAVPKPAATPQVPPPAAKVTEPEKKK